MLEEGIAALPVGCDSPLQIVMAVWRPFCLNLNFLGRVRCDSPLLKIKVHQMALTICITITPNQISQQNSLQRAGAP
jgi:hypothetical protein